MLRQRLALHPPRCAWLWLLAPTLGACSFFAPSLQDYAQPRPGSAGNGSAGLSTAGQGSSGEAGEAGTGGDGTGNGSGAGRSNAGASGHAGSGGSSNGGTANGGSAIGEAGWTGEVVLGETVAQSGVQLQPVVALGIPTYAPLTGYAADEATAASTALQSDAPLYKPYDSTAAGWWDNLVAEQMQARVPVVLLPTHGAYSLTATDLTGPDLMNPRRLAAWVSALDRAGAASLFQASCFVDMPSVQAVKNNFHSAAAGTLMDLAVQTDWDDVVWKRVLKPWFDALPTQYWYLQSGSPLIQWGGVPTTSFSHPSGNLSPMLTAVAASFQSAYGVSPAFVLDAGWFAAEPALSTNHFVIGKNSPLAAPSAAAGFATYAGFALGTILPGYADPAYYEEGNANYHEASLFISRRSTNSYGSTVSTLLTGLAAAAQNGTQFAVLQDFTDLNHRSGMYRSVSADWATPNEYLNLIRRYSDPLTVTLRLEAEGCDEYFDSTPGNSGAAFRRSGDLDIRVLSGGSGWAVTNTSAGEWLGFEGVDFSAGTYQFVAKYSTNSAASGAKRIQLLVDGQGLTPIIAADTASSDAFANTLLATRYMSPGQHALRVRFLDGAVDLDWLFVKKTDPVFSLRSTTGQYLTSQAGGGAQVTADAPKADVDERMTFDDINGGALEDGDSVYIQAADGLYLSTATASTQLQADQRQGALAGVFSLHNLDGGTLQTGSRVALGTADKQHYISVVSSTLVDASGSTLGDAQTFILKSY